jgi:hypothetical protein
VCKSGDLGVLSCLAKPSGNPTNASRRPSRPPVEERRIEREVSCLVVFLFGGNPRHKNAAPVCVRQDKTAQTPLLKLLRVFWLSLLYGMCIAFTWWLRGRVWLVLITLDCEYTLP